jgi:dTMP kinase
MTRGRFITFEGPEGSGKSTHVRRLADRIGKAGVRVLVTREPGGTRTGEAIRGILQHDAAGEPLSPRAELLLFEASRAQLVHAVIEPVLSAGTWVLCDRFADSSTAYQGYGRGFGVDAVLALNAFAVGDTVPDLTLLLDIEAGRGLDRVAERAGSAGAKDRIEREAAVFHDAVRRGFLDMARRWPDRIKVVRTDRDPDAVHEEIWGIVRAAMPLPPGV